MVRPARRSRRGQPVERESKRERVGDRGGRCGMGEEEVEEEDEQDWGHARSQLRGRGRRGQRPAFCSSH